MDTNKKISWPGWELVRRIGNGSFGTVYEIQRDIYGDIEKAALKVISIPHNEDEVDYWRCSGLDDASITQTFHQQVGDIAKEYKLMAQLRESPNIVRCDDFRDIQRDNGLGWDIYIKMELLTPLMKCLDRVATEEQVILLGMDICNALIDCQKKNIIHRDIKPQNVFVSESGRFKLGDFGIARTIERTTHATAGIGTYSYMAPEVERNEAYGKTADIYSLGLLLYWLLNERRGPFMPLPPNVPRYGDEEQARRRRFSGEPIPQPKNGSEKLKAIVLRACSFKPEDRFSDAAEMFAALNDLQNNQPAVSVIAPVLPEKEIPYEDDLTVAASHWNSKPEVPVIAPVLPEEEIPYEGDLTVAVWQRRPQPEAFTEAMHQPEIDDATVGSIFTRQTFKPEIPKAPAARPAQVKTSIEGPSTATASTRQKTGTVLPNGFWKCACGRVNAGYVSSCGCGINRREIKFTPEQAADVPAQKIADTPKNQPSSVQLPNGSWRCLCGRINASYVSSCACGRSKREAVSAPKQAADAPAQKNIDTSKNQPSSVQLPNGSWSCLCGRINASYVSSCACGRSKREAVSAPKQAADAPAQKNIDTPKTQLSSVQLPNGSWRCLCGRINASYVSSCACGRSKRDVVTSGK